jgi:hypothetical protein
VVYINRPLQPTMFETSFILTAVVATALAITLLIMQHKYMRLIRDDAISIRKAVQNIAFSRPDAAPTTQIPGGEIETLPSSTSDREASE